MEMNPISFSFKAFPLGRLFGESPSCSLGSTIWGVLWPPSIIYPRLPLSLSLLSTVIFIYFKENTGFCIFLEAFLLGFRVYLSMQENIIREAFSFPGASQAWYLSSPS